METLALGGSRGHPEPRGLRTPPTHPGAHRPWGPGQGGGGRLHSEASAGLHGPQSLEAETPPQRGRPSQSNGRGQEPPPTPAPIGQPAAFPGPSLFPQAEPGWSAPRLGCRAPTPPAALCGGRIERGRREGSPGARRPCALTMATPLNLRQSAPTARGASRGQVTPRPLQTPPSLAPPPDLQAAPPLARIEESESRVFIGPCRLSPD